MLRVLVLLVMALFFRMLLSRKSRRAHSAMSPYTNSFDSLLTAEEVSRELQKNERFRDQGERQAEPVSATAPQTTATQIY